jgi:hypothetical protein
MAEWLKASVLKTEDRKVRGFESLSLRIEFHSSVPPATASGYYVLVTIAASPATWHQ